MSAYGYCPMCFSEIICRTRGGPNAKDTCKKGHTFPSRESLDEDEAKLSLKAEIKETQNKIELLEKKLNKLEYDNGEVTE